MLKFLHSGSCPARPALARFGRLGLLSLALLLGPVGAWAQVIKTLPGNYANFTAAITDINMNFASGGVTVNVAPGYTETPTLALPMLTAQGTGGATGQIIFQKSSTGTNPKITAPAGTSVTLDGIIRLNGADYVTFDGIDLSESAANITTGTNTALMEFGYVMFRLTAINGCQNNTFRNCVVTLSKTNPSTTGTFGIYGAPGTSSAVAGVAATTAAGANSNNKVNACIVTNSLTGINFAAAAPASLALYDQSNEIGVLVANQVYNFGGSATGWGIGGTYQNAYKIVNNTINSTLNYAGGTTSPVAAATVTSTLRGIYGNSGPSANVDFTGNAVTLASGSTSSQIFGIDNGIGATAASNTVNITNNVVQMTYALATTAAIVGITNNLGTAATVNITGNTVQNVTAPAATTATFTGITGASGIAIGNTLNMNNNQVVNNTIAGTGTMTLLASTVNSATTPVSISNNTLSGNSKTPAGTATTSALLCLTLGPALTTITGNTITNNSIITSGTSTTAGTLTGINNTSPSTTTSEILTNNILTGLTISGTSTATTHTIRGILTANSGATDVQLLTGNTVGGLAISSGSGTTTGIFIPTGGGPGSNIARNKIYDLSAAGTGGFVNGITISGGGTYPVNNNLIGDLRTPASTNLVAVNGLNITSGTLVNAYYNTINIAASSTGVFGTSGIYLGSTTTSLDLRNNIVVNKSTGTGAGTAVALRLTSSIALANLVSTTNNNLYFAGTPSASNLIYVEGAGTQTNPQQTLSGYKTYVATPRETLSVTEDVPFASTTGSAANFLSLDLTKSTQAADYGAPISGVTDAYNGTAIRSATTPDIGAYEGAFVPYDLGITALTAPTGPQCASSTLQPITVTLRNFSTGSVTTSATAVVTVTGTLTKPNTSTVSLSYVLPAGTVLAAGSNTAITFTPSQDFSAAGTYLFSNLTVTITDGQTPASTYRESDGTNNTLSPNPTLTVNPLPTATLANNGPVCAGSTATLSGALTGTGPWSITYTTNGANPLTVSASTSPFSIVTGVLTANTTFAITGLTDAKCTASSFPAATTVTVNPLPTFTTAQTNVGCFGGSTGSITVTAAGGVTGGTFEYSKDNGVNYQASNVFGGLAAGTYQVRVRNVGGTQCAAAAQAVTITQPASAVSFTTTQTNAGCFGGSTGSITVTATGGTVAGGYQYSNDNGATFQVSNVFNGLVAGTYQMVVKDDNNCTATQAVTITQPASAVSVTATKTDETAPGANDGTVTATGAGGTSPYQYSVNGSTFFPAAATAGPYTFTGLAPNTYTVTVRDANACTATTTVTVGAAAVCTTDTWTGAVSTNWLTPGNWSCGQIPTPTVDAAIPTGSPNYPNLATAGTYEVRTLTIDNGASLSQSNGTLNVYGNLTSNTPAGNVALTGGVVAFRGGASATSGIATFYDLTVNLSAAAVLTLGDDAAVTHDLTMTQGVLATGAKTVTLPLGATLQTETDANYVLGQVAATGRTLSAGTAENFGGLGLTLTPAAASVDPGPTLVVRTTGTVLNGVGTSVSIKRYFDIQPATNTGLDVTMDFSYFDHERNGIVAGNVALFKSVSGPGGPWANQRPITIAGNSVTKTGITDFSIWTLGDAANPLPVELVAFDAQRQGEDAALTWATASEKNNRGFAVELSTDGRIFRELAFVAGAGSSSAPRRYGYLDRDAAKAGGLRYYRLRQVDFSGAASFSPVRTVAFGVPAGTRLSAMPTPFDGELTLLVQATSAQPAAQLVLVDATGRTVLERRLAVPAGSNQLPLAGLDGLPTGLYLLGLTVDGKTLHLKVVKR